MIHHIDQQEAAWLESDFEICRNFANVTLQSLRLVI